jgi:alkane 1-monooxygenase
MSYSYKFAVRPFALVERLDHAGFRYLLVLVFPAATAAAFFLSGILTFLPAIIFFGLVSMVELFVTPDDTNLSNEHKRDRINSRFFDILLYSLAVFQLGLLVTFLATISQTPAASIEFVGRILSMGMMCGLLGINLGHELGHRAGALPRRIAEFTLLTSLENHFLPYHNLGHHRNAATPGDPATARRGESVYAFWFRSQIGSYVGAWRIESGRLKKRGMRRVSIRNRMLAYTVAQTALLAIILIGFGIKALGGFIAAAVIGKILLETANYIEHYGLLRRKLANGRYERVGPEHSWNSNHPLSRAVLFELSRHSDHHFIASKPFQVLDSLPTSPQMPTGYPGMMLLSLVPPLWFRVMDRRVDNPPRSAGD